MEVYILKESVLNDDILLLSDNNKVFKGGYIAIIKFYTFLNEWCNKEHVIKFRNENRLQDYLSTHYPQFEI